MAQRTLLQIINAAQRELGLPVSSSVINNTSDATAVQMLSFAQLEIEELNQCHNWTKLQSEYNLIVNTPTITTGDVTANSTVITGIPSTTGITAYNYQVWGNGIPLAARVLSVDSATQITMTMESISSGTAETLTFMQDTYPIPTDFSRYVNDTWWDRTNHWRLIGPDSPQEDQWHRSGIYAVGPRRHWRQLGYQTNAYRIWPPPSELIAPLQLVFEYISNYNVYVGGSISSPAYDWQSDTDTPILDDRAIIMGIVWRFWAQKGLNWTLKRTEYDNYVERLKARDGGAPKLNMVPRASSILLTSMNIQDANFPGPAAGSS